MAVLGLDTLLLLAALLPYIKLSKFFEATHYVLNNMQSVVPHDLSDVDRGAKSDADLLKSAARGGVGGPAPGGNNKKKKRDKHKQQAAQDFKDPLTGASLTCYRERVVMVNQTFYAELESLLWTAFVGVSAFSASEILFCLTGGSFMGGRQAATTTFLLGIALRCLVILLSLASRMWSSMGNRENQLSLVMGIFSAWAYLGFMGMVSETEAFPDLDVARVIQASDKNGRSRLWWAVSASVAVLCGLFAGSSLLSGFRFARVYHESTAMREDREAVGAASWREEAGLHLSFLGPLLVVLLYAEPLVGEPVVRIIFGASAEGRAAWVQTRSALVIVLCAVRVAMLSSLVQRFLDSAYLVLAHMVSDPKSFSTATMRGYAKGQRNICAYAAVQFLAPSLLTFSLALARPRIAGDGFGCCDAVWAMAARAAPGVSRPAGRSDGPGMFWDALAKVVPPELLGGDGQVDFSSVQALLGPIVDLLIVASCASWVVCVLVGLFHFRGQNTARIFANVSKLKVQ